MNPITFRVSRMYESPSKMFFKHNNYYNGLVDSRGGKYVNNAVMRPSLQLF